MTEETNQEAYSDDEEISQGDLLYISVGLDPIHSVSSTTYLIPPTGGGPCIPAYRLEINYVNSDINWEKLVPLDDLIALIEGLTACISPATLSASSSGIAMLSASKEGALAKLLQAKSNLEDVHNFLSNFSVNEFKSDEKTPSPEGSQ